MNNLQREVLGNIDRTTRRG